MDRGGHSATTARMVLRAAAHRGLDTQAVAADIGLSWSVVEDPAAYIPAEQHFAMWERVMRGLRDPHLPVEAPQTSFAEQRSLVTLSALTATTVAAALEAGALRSGAFTSIYELQARAYEDGMGLCVVGLGVDRLGERCEAEYTVSDALNVGRMALGAGFTPARVWFRHDPPATIEAHRRWFGPGLAFGQERTEIVFSHEQLELAMGTGHPTLHGLIDKRLETAGPGRQFAPAMAERVSELVGARLASGAIRVRDVTAALHVSERTMHRRLAEEGTSFRAVLEDVRRRRAQALLERRDMATKEVASQLGFASTRSFYRAFRRWTGSSPRQSVPR